MASPIRVCPPSRLKRATARRWCACGRQSDEPSRPTSHFAAAATTKRCCKEARRRSALLSRISRSRERRSFAARDSDCGVRHRRGHAWPRGHGATPPAARARFRCPHRMQIGDHLALVKSWRGSPYASSFAAVKPACKERISLFRGSD
jgi:hypothetical protein